MLWLGSEASCLAAAAAHARAAGARPRRHAPSSLPATSTRLQPERVRTWHRVSARSQPSSESSFGDGRFGAWPVRGGRFELLFEAFEHVEADRARTDDAEACRGEKTIGATDLGSNDVMPGVGGGGIWSSFARDAPQQRQQRRRIGPQQLRQEDRAASEFHAERAAARASRRVRSGGKVARVRSSEPRASQS